MGKLGYSSKLLREFWRFAMNSKSYWIIPLVLVLIVMGFLIAASQSATPFIYTLF